MEPEETSDQLTISLEQAFFIIVKARKFDEQVESTDPDSGSNPADDREVDVLEEGADNPVQQEFEEALDALNVDEHFDLIALTLLGRGGTHRSPMRARKRSTCATNTFRSI